MYVTPLSPNSQFVMYLLLIIRYNVKDLCCVHSLQRRISTKSSISQLECFFFLIMYQLANAGAHAEPLHTHIIASPNAENNNYINQYPLPPSKKLLTRYYLHDQNKLIPVIVIPGMIILYVVRKWMAPLAPPPKFGSRCCYCTSALVGHAKETQRMPGMLATSQPASQLATHKRTYKYKDEY